MGTFVLGLVLSLTIVMGLQVEQKGKLMGDGYPIGDRTTDRSI